MTARHDFEDESLGLMRVLHLLETRIDPFAVYLFGSAARSTLRDDSDVDLAFLSDTAPTAYDQYLLAEEAAELLNQKVDLVQSSDRRNGFLCASYRVWQITREPRPRASRNVPNSNAKRIRITERRTRCDP